MSGVIFTTLLDEERVTAIEDGLGYVERRLLGLVPRALVELCTEITGAFWEGAGADIAVRMTGGDCRGISARADVDDVPQIQVAAEDAQEEAFWRFEEAHRAETEVAFQAWLEAQAAEFMCARGRWRAERRAALREAFARTAGADRG